MPKFIPSLLTILATAALLSGCASISRLRGDTPAPPSPTLTAPVSPTAQVPVSPVEPPSPVPVSTPTEIPPNVRAWGNYPGPTIWPPVEIPPPMGILAQPKGQIHVLLLGDDQRPNEQSFRTDSIMLLTVHPQGKISLTSFPRDLYVYAPGWTMQRINVVFGRGGFDLMALTMEYNFGVRPQYYAKINVWSLLNLIDSLGGIDVQVAYAMSDQDPDDINSMKSVPAGTVHMDGKTAAWYCRARMASSDFDRSRRQQEVLQALFTRLMTMNALERVPELYQTFRSSIETNMTFENITQWIPLAARLGLAPPVNQYLIGSQHTIEYTVPTDGSRVLLPRRDAVQAVMQQAVSP